MKVSKDFFELLEVTSVSGKSAIIGDHVQQLVGQQISDHLSSRQKTHRTSWCEP